MWTNILINQAFEVEVDGGISDLVAIREELMIATRSGRIFRYSWEGQEIRDYSLDLRRIPFCVDQQVSFHLKSMSVPKATLSKPFATSDEWTFKCGELLHLQILEK